MPKVLVVEDDLFITRLYSKVLESEGYEVQLADNGLSALEQLFTFEPDIILLDIMMPTMNGMEFLKKANGRTAPIIVLTNMAETKVASDAISAGARLVLIKSDTEPDNVIAAIKSVLENTQQQAASQSVDQPPAPDADTPPAEPPAAQQ